MIVSYSTINKSPNSGPVLVLLYQHFLKPTNQIIRDFYTDPKGKLSSCYISRIFETDLVNSRSSNQCFRKLAGKRSINSLVHEVLELRLIVGRRIICSEMADKTYLSEMGSLICKHPNLFSFILPFVKVDLTKSPSYSLLYNIAQPIKMHSAKSV